MKKYKRLVIGVVCILLLSCTLGIHAYARAGGGGSGGGGGGSSGGSNNTSHYTGRSGGRRAHPLESVLNAGIMIIVFAGGTIVFTYRAHKAKVKSVRLIKQYEKLGINWDYKEIQNQVEKAYFEIQECWRRMDAEYASEYLSRDIRESWHAKLEWMKLRDEEVVQRNVRLLSAMPVYVIDEEGEDRDRIWYLIHGKMTGYYINKNTRLAVRGNTMPESFYEYWLFIYQDGRWVLQEIKQKDELDISQFSDS